MALKVVSILSSSEAGKVLDQSKPPIPASKHLVTKATKRSDPPPVPAKKPVVGAEPMKTQKLNEYFRKFVVELLKMFDQDRTLLEDKGSFIIR